MSGYSHSSTDNILNMLFKESRTVNSELIPPTGEAFWIWKKIVMEDILKRATTVDPFLHDQRLSQGQWF
jgi:hypothetical protein